MGNGAGERIWRAGRMPCTENCLCKRALSYTHEYRLHGFKYISNDTFASCNTHLTRKSPKILRKGVSSQFNLMKYHRAILNRNRRHKQHRSFSNNMTPHPFLSRFTGSTKRFAKIANAVIGIFPEGQLPC